MNGVPWYYSLNKVTKILRFTVHKKITHCHLVNIFICNEYSNKMEHPLKIVKNKVANQTNYYRHNICCWLSRKMLSAHLYAKHDANLALSSALFIRFMDCTISTCDNT